MRVLSRLINVIADISGHFSGWLVPIMMFLVLVEVVSRYVAHQPLLIADEFSAYILVALTFIGLGYTWKEKGHIRIDAVTSRLPVTVVIWLRAITLVMSLAFSVMLSIESYGFVTLSFARHMKSHSWLSTPLQGPHITVSLGFTILTIVLIGETIKAIRALKTNQTIEDREP